MHKEEVDAIMARIEVERDACVKELAVLKATVEEMVVKASQPTSSDEQAGDTNTPAESGSDEE